MTPLPRVAPALFALSLLAPAQAAEPVPEQDLTTIVEELESWLDENAPWPRRERPPTIRRWPPSLTAALFPPAADGTGNRRGFYDPDTATITLVAPWDARDPTDRSVLLHELAHHRQAPLHWYCPAAQELPAYRLQAAWAAENDARPAIDWLDVVLRSGCTPRDIHPE